MPPGRGPVACPLRSYGCRSSPGGTRPPVRRRPLPEAPAGGSSCRCTDKRTGRRGPAPGPRPGVRRTTGSARSSGAGLRPGRSPARLTSHSTTVSDAGRAGGRGRPAPRGPPDGLPGKKRPMPEGMGPRPRLPAVGPRPNSGILPRFTVDPPLTNGGTAGQSIKAPTCLRGGGSGPVPVRASGASSACPRSRGWSRPTPPGS